MRNPTWQSAWSSLCAAMLVVCFNVSAQADWSEDFNSGSFNNFWQFGSDGGDANTFLGGQIIGGELVLTADTTPGEGGAQTGFGVVLTEVFDDVLMTGVINPSGNGDINDSVGLLIRGNTVNQTFYMAEVNYNAQELIIYRNNPGVSGGNSNLVVEPLSISFTDSVYVEFEAIGSQLTAWAFEDETKANQLAMATFDDTDPAALSSGLSGVLVNENFGGLPVLGIWDDLTASRIVAGNPSDIDGDGDVDGDDFLQIQQEFGSTTGAQDIADWQTNYGTSSLAAVAVPEPATLALAAGCLLIGALRRQ